MYANVDFRSGHVSQFQEYSRKGISFKYTDEDIKIIVASNYITGAARRPAVRIYTVMTIIAFLYISSRLLAMQKPWLQAFSDCISDMTDLLDPITTAMQFRVIDSNGLY